MFLLQSWSINKNDYVLVRGADVAFCDSAFNESAERLKVRKHVQQNNSWGISKLLQDLEIEWFCYTFLMNS